MIGILTCDDDDYEEMWINFVVFSVMWNLFVVGYLFLLNQKKGNSYAHFVDKSNSRCLFYDIFLSLLRGLFMFVSCADLVDTGSVSC